MRSIRFVLALCVLASCFALPVSAAEEVPELSARSAIVMEADSGDVLLEADADEPMLIASTTKIMTALVVLENTDPDMIVTVDASWTGIEGSSMYLAPGQELTVRELLYGLMLASGNDAAVALACVTAGSVDDFAALMNERAVSLGCENTHFVNPNGLDAEGHYSSARDLALITREAIRNEDFRAIVSCEAVTVGELTFSNHNRLLRECEGVFGVKTGYTEAAGRSLVTCCERDGLTLICVTLSDPDDWSDHTRLYDWAYSLYTVEDVLPAGSAWTVPVIGGLSETVTVSPERDVSVLHRADETLTVMLRLPSFVYASVAAGDEAGQAVIYADGAEVAAVPIVYDEDVERETAPTLTLRERLAEIFGGGERKIYTLS